MLVYVHFRAFREEIELARQISDCRLGRPKPERTGSGSSLSPGKK